MARWRFGEPTAPLRRLLARGGVLVVPTETSYGLACHPGNPDGVAAVYRIKERERGKPLPVVVAHVDALTTVGISPRDPWVAAVSAWWPGPLTAVLPLEAPLAASAGRAELAVRVPGHSRLRALLQDLGGALTATSANRSGEPPIHQPAAAEDLVAGEDAVVVDGGDLPPGPPSTIVAWGDGGWRLVREGAIPAARLAGLLGDTAGSSR